MYHYRLYYSAPKLHLVFSFLTKKDLMEKLKEHGKEGHIDIYENGLYRAITDIEFYELFN